MPRAAGKSGEKAWKPATVPDEPEITRTFPSRVREGYEKYSAETSAAIKSSCEAAGVKINPVPECLDGRHDAGRKRAPGQAFEVSGQGPEGAAAEIPEELTLVLEEDP